MAGRKKTVFRWPILLYQSISMVLQRRIINFLHLACNKLKNVPFETYIAVYKLVLQGKSRALNNIVQEIIGLPTKDKNHLKLQLQMTIQLIYGSRRCGGTLRLRLTRADTPIDLELFSRRVF